MYIFPIMIHLTPGRYALKSKISHAMSTTGPGDFAARLCRHSLPATCPKLSPSRVEVRNTSIANAPDMPFIDLGIDVLSHLFALVDVYTVLSLSRVSQNPNFVHALDGSYR